MAYHKGHIYFVFNLANQMINDDQIFYIVYSIGKKYCNIFNVVIDVM